MFRMVTPMGGALITPTNPTSVAQTYAQKLIALAPANLLVYWKFNEASGNAADSSGNGRTGTVSGGVTYSAAGIGDGLTAFAFDGINGLVSAASAWLNPNACTIAGWFKSNWGNATTWDLFGKVVDGNNLIYLSKAGANLAAYVYNAGGAGSVQELRAPTGTGWRHFALTVANPGNLIAYLDGAASAGAAVSGTFAGTANFQVANSAGYGFLNGSAQHIAVWDTVLTPAQITQLATV